MLLICANCSKEFNKAPKEFRRSHRDFCSRACSRAFNKNNKNRPVLKNKCKICKTKIDFTRTVCSPECYEKFTGKSCYKRVFIPKVLTPKIKIKKEKTVSKEQEKILKERLNLIKAIAAKIKDKKEKLYTNDKALDCIIDSVEEDPKYYESEEYMEQLELNRIRRELNVGSDEHEPEQFKEL